MHSQPFFFYKKKAALAAPFSFFCLLCRRAVIVQRNHTDNAQYGNDRAQYDRQTGEDRAVYGGQEERCHSAQQTQCDEGKDRGGQFFHKFHG
jgi:hypothetical protein